MQKPPPAVLERSNPCSPLSLEPSQIAVLVLDLHAFFFGFVPETGPGVLSASKQLLDFSRRNGFRVAHCLIDADQAAPPHLKSSARANGIAQAAKAKPELLLEPPELRAPSDRDDEPTFLRPPGIVSALESKGIKDWLEKDDIKGVVLVGLSTSGCLINTAKAAADTGLITTVVEDGCADLDPAVHKMVLTKLLVGQCHIVSLDAWEEAWTVSHIVGLGRAGHAADQIQASS
jgi:nicotinamidase-related amidase